MSAKSNFIVQTLAASALFAAVAAATSPAAAQAAPPVKPPAIAQTCTACHGAKGISSTRNTPSLAGQPDIFTQYQLVFMRDGGRQRGSCRRSSEPDRRQYPRSWRLLRGAAAAARARHQKRGRHRYRKGHRPPDVAPLRQLPQAGFCRPGRERAAGRAAAGISQEGFDRLSHRGAARARDGRHDRGVGHPSRTGDRHDRGLSGAQALTRSLNSTHHRRSTLREKAHGLENTPYCRDRRRHGNQLLRLRRPAPVSAAAPKPRDSGGRPR